MAQNQLGEIKLSYLFDPFPPAASMYWGPKTLLSGHVLRNVTKLPRSQMEIGPENDAKSNGNRTKRSW